ncbi:MAG TPA: nucleotidyltransferase domain-containing protein [Thermoanaerobacterales bacterium]|nr:nucleotidyltransferase domain-containing protein [Thermoanaerobacterales bacterium]
MKKELKIYDDKIKNVLNEVQARMLMLFGSKLKKIILFGSYARNEADNESDIDILLLIDEDKSNLKQYHDCIVDVVVELSIKYKVVLSILEQEYQKYNKYMEFIPFYTNVENEGIELYAR